MELSDWMKVVKTKSRCHEMAFNLFKGQMERGALGFIWHVYWISFVCLSGLYTGSSTPHHSASVELLSPTTNPTPSTSATDLPSRQHRLDRDLGSPHHLSPLAAMDGPRDGWVLRVTWMYSAVAMCHTHSDTHGHCGGHGHKCARRVGNINIKSGKSVHFPD